MVHLFYATTHFQFRTKFVRDCLFKQSRPTYLCNIASQMSYILEMSSQHQYIGTKYPREAQPNGRDKIKIQL